MTILVPEKNKNNKYKTLCHQHINNFLQSIASLIPILYSHLGIQQIFLCSIYFFFGPTPKRKTLLVSQLITRVYKVSPSKNFRCSSLSRVRRWARIQLLRASVAFISTQATKRLWVCWNKIHCLWIILHALHQSSASLGLVLAVRV